MCSDFSYIKDDRYIAARCNSKNQTNDNQTAIIKFTNSGAYDLVGKE